MTPPPPPHTRKRKRQRPGSSSSSSSSSSSPSPTSPSRRLSVEPIISSDLPTPFTPSRAFRASTVPQGLFPGRVASLSAKRYTRSRRSRARFFLFENQLQKSQQQTQQTRRPLPKRPVASMLNFVQILTTPTADTPGTCLLVHHDNRRYLFGNVAEGTQRVFVQQKVSLSRVEEIFLTGPVSWHTAGGLLGMVLTVAEVVQAARTAAVEEAKQKAAKKLKTGGAAAVVTEAAAAPLPEPKSLSIHGGTNLTHLLATARRFVFRKGLPIHPHEVRQDTSTGGDGDGDGGGEAASSVREPDWSDDNIMVWYVPVFADTDTPSSGRSGSTTTTTTTTGTTPVPLASTPEDDAADRQLVESVVAHMFDSNWKLDALVETTLHAAKLPAKLFVKNEHGHLTVYDGPLPGEAPDVPDIPVLVRQPWPAALIQSLPRTAPVRQSMCYVVRNHTRRGKVNAAEAARLGVAKHHIRRLVEGHDVTAADGSTVTPAMVVGAPIEGAAFAVVDLPDVSYVGAFLAQPEWSSSLVTAINTIFWLLGPGVVHDPRLQAFMRAHPGIRHTVSSPDTCANRLALSSAAALQVKHNRVDPDRFPLQQYNNVAPSSDSSSLSSSSTASSDTLSPLPPFAAARPGWAVQLSPQIVEDDRKVFSYVDFAAAVRELDPEVLALADAARAEIATPAFQAAAAASNVGLPHPDTEVIPLGTGSAMPSKYRNVSATLVRVPGVGSYLFDCGENTLGSLRRLFGTGEQLAAVLRDLRVVWISHLHADHHLGTVSVLRAWRDATAAAAAEGGGATTAAAAALPRLAVASHHNMLHWLREYADVEDFGLDRLRPIEIDAVDLRRSRVCPPVVFAPAEAAEFGLQRIDACRVEHCHGALAVVFTWASSLSSSSAASSSAPSEQSSTGATEADAATPPPPPLKIAYSGDCRPSDDFAQIGRGATLLVHESTFDDELAGEAAAKKHSTMGEALQVGRAMGARRVLLTHFSQRYPKIPLFGDNADGGGGTSNDNSTAAEMQVLVAFDHMRVRLGDFRTAAAFLPALQKLYEGVEKV
ncbi:tRNA processing endoribonuclease [Niveomyces insectorum RCEF 264]|uniref:ribonuclease Z n=1 Tax=Niveomyces insectorum RCEF 264 TaxID=1081102 RepID=A0A167RIE2_9HYPO|nr:tRNA processing endoribonuclease [Niveomyces insectorum RCEF 264]